MNNSKKLSQSQSRETLGKELEDVFSYFSLSTEDKAKKFDSIIGDSIKLSEQIKDKLMNGSGEEKKEMENLLMNMAEKVQEETNRICDEIGITKDELIAFTQNPDNFSREEWEAVQEAKDYVKEIEQEAPKPSNSAKKVPISDWVHS